MEMENNDTIPQIVVNVFLSMQIYKPQHFQYFLQNCREMEVPVEESDLLQLKWP